MGKLNLKIWLTSLGMAASLVAMLVALSKTCLHLFFTGNFVTKASLQLCQSPNKVKLCFTFSLVSATSSTRPICRRRIFKTIFTQECLYKVSIDCNQSTFKMTFRADWGSKRMLSWKASSAWRCPTVLTIRSFQTILTKNSSKMTRFKLSNVDLYPVRNPCSECCFVHSNFETGRLHHLSQGGTVMVMWIDNWIVSYIDRLWRISIWSVRWVALPYNHRTWQEHSHRQGWMGNVLVLLIKKWSVGWTRVG